MIDFYYHPTPNPSKVALFLEEAEIDYQLIPIDTSRGEQHTPAYRAINPNGKVPALTDGDVTLFDSSAILLYLGEKTGRFMGDPSPESQAELMSWMMLIGTGVGPFTGQAIHFKHYAPKPNDYALHRYVFEAERHWDLIDQRLATRHYMMGEHYTIVDMSLWGWCRGIDYLMGDAGWVRFPNVKRLYDELNSRPAAQRANALRTRHAFKTELDDETKASLFQHGQLAA
ncbi:glutathione S-transferase family protein [Castellaniella sp.]|uniref:glutathione S-transferase family protein n=1 Tax=Castellaniella sp. TaxID=1955812 RepID=UPI002AFE6CC4|nr:glutathione S-transferase N-terminal domain-containing protein [Castellaniella sp.]